MVTLMATNQPHPPPSSLSQTELPFTGLSGPQGAAVDSSGAIYVADRIPFSHDA